MVYIFKLASPGFRLKGMHILYLTFPRGTDRTELSSYNSTYSLEIDFVFLAS